MGLRNTAACTRAAAIPTTKYQAFMWNSVPVSFESCGLNIPVPHVADACTAEAVDVNSMRGLGGLEDAAPHL